MEWGYDGSFRSSKAFLMLRVANCELSSASILPGHLTVMAGLGSSMSSGPQAAISLTNAGARLSLRKKGKRQAVATEAAAKKRKTAGRKNLPCPGGGLKATDIRER